VKQQGINTYREDFLLTVKAVGHLLVFGTLGGNAKEHTEAISQLVFLIEGLGVFYFSISKWHNGIPRLLVNRNRITFTNIFTSKRVWPRVVFSERG